MTPEPETLFGLSRFQARQEAQGMEPQVPQQREPAELVAQEWSEPPQGRGQLEMEQPVAERPDVQ